ncbi:MAG TPA: arsenate reductase [Accumulibacter sp.]|uniref:arsenate reductase n=1 Tax=Accumulibacter sp. TaxID=2053492 RepID=UPI002BED659F|nr:arsenate reductase [Accumulibacter sp.]HRF71742.1 arsenate reductase [Accumulibacter sp.]
MTVHPPPRRCCIFGIRNCDTMKKAFAWLAGHGVVVDFVDYRKAGISIDQLSEWSRRAGWENGSRRPGWETLLNTRGTTWKKLPAEARADLDEARALTLMAAQPSLIRRPVIDTGDALLIGFDPQRYASEFLGTDP